MATIGKHQKPCALKKLRQFAGWCEKAQNARKVKLVVGTEELEAPRILMDDDELYLQENYNVTDGIFKDEHVIFDTVTPDWIKFCQEVLGFGSTDIEPSKPEMVDESEQNGDHGYPSYFDLWRQGRVPL